MLIIKWSAFNLWNLLAFKNSNIYKVYSILSVHCVRKLSNGPLFSNREEQWDIKQSITSKEVNSGSYAPVFNHILETHGLEELHVSDFAISSTDGFTPMPVLFHRWSCIGYPMVPEFITTSGVQLSAASSVLSDPLWKCSKSVTESLAPLSPSILHCQLRY